MFCTLIRVSLRFEFLVAHPNQCTTLTPRTDQKKNFTFFHILPWCKISNDTTKDYKILIFKIIFSIKNLSQRFLFLSWSRTFIIFCYDFLNTFIYEKKWSIVVLSFVCATRNSNLESYLTLIQVPCGKPSPISRT